MMKSILSAAIFAAGLFLSTTTGHSWLECTKDEVIEYDKIKADPSQQLKVVCHGFPRNKVNNGDWIAESSNYLWDLASERATNEPGGRRACHPGQRTAIYVDKAPIAKVKAGETLRLRFWGNGHTSYAYGRPLHQDPGLVRVYHIPSGDGNILASELTVDKLMSEGNFSADAVSRPKEGNLPDDKANWMSLTIPPNFGSGRKMFVWAWAPIKDDFQGGWRNRYTTCFDFDIAGKVEGANNNPAPPPPPKPIEDPKKKVNEQCAKTCYRGGMKEHPCAGGNCPPCRYGESCFEYDSSGKCPSWAGGFDCIKGTPI
ncbi:hypothetical protein BDZ91DRAFT_236375 [Kalaharituber pfeilii]|nr:hypothetical protein BDZ91DRAFT_236375 [Kalaharituber pfeilii]